MADDDLVDPMRDDFVDSLAALGFVHQGASRRGGSMWTLAFNRYLTFTVHDFGDHVLVSWSVTLGEYLLARGWQLGAGETTFQELYPRADSRLPADAGAVKAEISRVLATLRLDLGDPDL